MLYGWFTRIMNRPKKVNDVALIRISPERSTPPLCVPLSGDIINYKEIALTAYHHLIIFICHVFASPAIEAVYQPLAVLSDY